MSIVAVHGPNTFGSKGIIGNATGRATADPANGMHWVFTADSKYTSVTAADYDWAYSPATGTPASGAATLNLGRTLDVVFSGADGNRTVTLTYQGVAQSPTLVVPAAAGAAPMLRSLPPEEGGEEITEEIPETVPEPGFAPAQETSMEAYDPGDHTVAEVQQYVTDNPDALEAVYEAEYNGKARSTLVTWLEERFPYDPGAWTVAEVLDYAEANPAELEDIITAEQAGKNRTTLLSQLEGLRE